MSSFASEAMLPGHPGYSDATARLRGLYHRDEELRSPFYRDYTRILHCNAYRRLKHKTQVFFATGNDHICTRMEHVQHVATISYTLAKALGLNTELAQAIALGHDLGHAPFGHHGEEVLRRLVQREIGESEDYWHERNSLRFADLIETLPDSLGNEQNLNLTYGVRDGIICHCGEVTDEALAPRSELVDLSRILHANQYTPWTWEG
ncbi:MAG: HD domain-containing protein, partial [Symbiobacteriaceae bacterium]|nr:HD domain-containing protein [Symbiobacteriaceae bacterium]